jgi:hypothetical protein
MELAKEIELIILDKIAENGKITDRDFDQLFQENDFEYNLALTRIINANSAWISKISRSENEEEGSHYGISEYGRLRRRALQQEKNRERITRLLQARLTKHVVVVEKGTRILIIVSIATVIAAMYLIHLESVHH